MKRVSRPMLREDWAWLLTCVVCGLFAAALAILPDIANGGPRHISKYNYDTGKWDESTAPAYQDHLSVQTNGDLQKMMQAVYKIDPDSLILSSRNHPKLTGSDYFQIIFGAIFSFIMISYLFRILEKICRKVIGIKPEESMP